MTDKKDFPNKIWAIPTYHWSELEHEIGEGIPYIKESLLDDPEWLAANGLMKKPETFMVNRMDFNRPMSELPTKFNK